MANSEFHKIAAIKHHKVLERKVRGLCVIKSKIENNRTKIRFLWIDQDDLFFVFLIRSCPILLIKIYFSLFPIKIGSQSHILSELGYRLLFSSFLKDVFFYGISSDVRPFEFDLVD